MSVCSVTVSERERLRVRRARVVRRILRTPLLSHDGTRTLRAAHHRAQPIAVGLAVCVDRHDDVARSQAPRPSHRVVLISDVLAHVRPDPVFVLFPSIIFRKIADFFHSSSLQRIALINSLKFIHVLSFFFENSEHA